MLPAQQDPVAHLKALIACRSVTPAEGGAHAYLAGVLEQAGFAVDRMTFSAPDTPDVDNLFATIGSGAPHLVFAGHTDVVPPGNEARWSHPPFAGDTAEGMIYGRGAVDMKGGIAAFLAAALAVGKPEKGTLSLLITGDEEGPGINGTVKLLEWAGAQGHRFDAALVGEPTSRDILGDTIKVGRRGSLSATIRVTGEQGHAAYPHLADNPVPVLVRILSRLESLVLDTGSADFQPSNLEITSVDVGNPSFNVIPHEAAARFNIRFNDHWTPERLEGFLGGEIAEAAGDGDWELMVEPGASSWFLTRSEALVGELTSAIRDVTGVDPELSTGGGTSDARFFKDICPVVEFGLVGQTMHQVDEHVAIDDLTRLTVIYRRFIDHFLAEFGRAP
jgi:succinyl-diaminopimelate desuccinylase